MEDLGSSSHLRLSGASQAWSERTDLQVQKMEQTIEQDLAKAMAGLREQFRQHPKFGSDTEMSPPSQAAVQAAAQAQAGAVALTDFRSEAAAARNEMLDGLARLRRELEAQRQPQPQPQPQPTCDWLQQSSPALTSSLSGEGSRQLLQAAAMEAALTDLRHGLTAQQAGLAELRQDVVAQLEFTKRDATLLEREIHRLSAELELVRTQRPLTESGVPAQESALLRTELHLLGDRLDHWEARREGPEVAQLQVEVHSVREELATLRAAVAGGGADMEVTRQMSAEELGRWRDAVGALRAPSAVDRVAEGLEAESRQRRTEVEALKQHVEEVQRGSLASFQEIAEGLMLECTSRQAQVLELRRSLADDITASMEAARDALRADVVLHCRELRGELGVQLEALEKEVRNSGERLRDSVRGGPPDDDITARVRAIEAEVNRNLVAMGQQLDPSEAQLQPGDGEQGSLLQRPLLSEGLKESLEQLVDKVNRTLKPSTDGTEAAVEQGTHPSSSEGWSAACGHALRSLPPGPLLAAGQGPVPHTPSRVAASVSFPVQSPVVLQYNMQPNSFTPALGVKLPASQLLVNTNAPLVAGTFVQRHPTPGPLQAGPKPTVVLPMSEPAAGSSPGHQASQPSIPPSDGGNAGSPEATSGAGEAAASKETFKRCLQELREENHRLREGTGNPVGSGTLPGAGGGAVASGGAAVGREAATASPSSVSFSVATPQFPTMSQVSSLQVAPAVAMAAAAQPALVMGGMTPNPVYRTISQRRTLSPTPAAQISTVQR